MNPRTKLHLLIGIAVLALIPSITTNIVDGLKTLSKTDMAESKKNLDESTDAYQSCVIGLTYLKTIYDNVSMRRTNNRRNVELSDFCDPNTFLGAWLHFYNSDNIIFGSMSDQTQIPVCGNNCKRNVNICRKFMSGINIDQLKAKLIEKSPVNTTECYRFNLIDFSALTPMKNAKVGISLDEFVIRPVVLRQFDSVADSFTYYSNVNLNRIKQNAAKFRNYYAKVDGIINVVLKTGLGVLMKNIPIVGNIDPEFAEYFIKENILKYANHISSWSSYFHLIFKETSSGVITDFRDYLMNTMNQAFEQDPSNGKSTIIPPAISEMWEWAQNNENTLLKYLPAYNKRTKTKWMRQLKKYIPLDFF